MQRKQDTLDHDHAGIGRRLGALKKIWVMRWGTAPLQTHFAICLVGALVSIQRDVV